MSIVGTTYSQISIAFRSIEQAHFLNDIWSLQLQNTNNAITVFVQAEINGRTQGKIYEARTQPFVLQQGVQWINSGIINIQEIFKQPNISDTLLTNELYTIYIKVYAYPMQSVLTEISESITVNALNNDSSKINLKSKIKFGLTGSLIGQYAKVLKTDTSIYPSYGRFGFQPTMQIYNIPIKANLYITTEQKFKNSQLNYYNIEFDQQKFKELMLEEIRKKLNNIIEKQDSKDIAILKQINEDYLQRTIPNYKELSNQLKNPDFLRQLDITEQLNVLDKYAKNPKIRKGLIKLEKWQEKLNIQSFEDAEKIASDMKRFNLDKTFKLLNELPKIDSLSTFDNLEKYLRILDISELDSLAKITEKDFLAQKWKHIDASKQIQAIKDLTKNAKLKIGLNEIDSLINEFGTQNLTDKSHNLEELENILSQLSKLSLQDSLQTALDIKNSIVQMNYDFLRGSKVDDIYKDYVLSQVAKCIDSFTIAHPELNNLNDAKHYFDEWSSRNIKEWKQIFDFKTQTTSLQTLAEKKIKNKKLKEIQKYKDKIKDVDKINVNDLLNDEKSLSALKEKLNILSKKEMALLGLKDFQAGITQPNQSLYTTNGIRLYGVNFKYVTEKIYTGFVSGRIGNINNTILNSALNILNGSTLDIDSSSQNHNILGISAGYGNETNKYIHINYLYGFNKQVNNTISIEQQNLQSKRNHVIGLSLGGKFLKDKIVINSEIAYSSTLKLSNATIKGIAFQLNGFVKIKDNTQLNVKQQYINSGFYSYGLPYVIKDQLNTELGIENNFKLNSITTLISYKISSNNMSDTISKFYTHSISTVISLQKEDWPYLSISFFPTFIRYKKYDASSSLKNINYQSNLSATLGYKYTFGKVKNTTQVNYLNVSLYNAGLINLVEGQSISINYYDLYLSKINNVNISHTMTFKKPLDVKFQAVFNIPKETTSVNKRFYMFDASCSLRLPKKSVNTIGFKYAHEVQGNQITEIYLQSAFPVTKYMQFNLQFKYDIINGIIEQNRHKYNGLMGKASINFRL